MGLYDYNIYSMMKRNARIFANRVALISGDEKVSHREFLEKVNGLACGLFRAGLKKGDRVAVLAQNSLEFVYLYGAAAKIGAIMLPINWRLKAEEMEYIINDGTPKVMFVGSEFQTMVTPFLSKSGFQKKCYSMGEASGDFAPFDTLMENDGIYQGGNSHSDEYVIIYTAAIHGRPRGATLTHRNIILSNLQSMYCWRLTKEDVHILMLPLFHLAGLCTALTVMHAGGLNIILPKFDVDLALKHIQQDKVTIYTGFPPMLDLILDKAREGNYDLTSLRFVLGMEKPETLRRLESTTGATSWTAYAQTEISTFVTLAPYFERLGSAGLPTFLAEVEIMDENGRILEAGRSGEIVVRGPTVFKGYWNLDQDNEFTFRDGWHHTGDMGHFDEDGYLWYDGRTLEKDLIKSGGENVYPAEVEKVILEHLLVQEVAVIGVPDAQWGEAIKAVCVLKKGQSLTEAELVEFVGNRIARFKKPKYVIFVSDLPKTEVGTIDKQKVKSVYAGN